MLPLCGSKIELIYSLAVNLERGSIRRSNWKCICETAETGCINSICSSIYKEVHARFLLELMHGFQNCLQWCHAYGIELSKKHKSQLWVQKSCHTTTTFVWFYQALDIHPQLVQKYISKCQNNPYIQYILKMFKHERRHVTEVFQNKLRQIFHKALECWEQWLYKDIPLMLK